MRLLNISRALFCSMTLTFSISSVSVLACEDDSTFDLEKYKQELYTMMDEDEAASTFKISESSPVISKVGSKKEEEKIPASCEDECAKICSDIALAPAQTTPTIHFTVINHIQNIINYNNNVIIINNAAPQPKHWTHPNYKTEFCDNWKKTGKCPYGNVCQFAHSKEEKVEKKVPYNYKTEKCKNYWGISGRCKYGNRCRFLH